MLHAYMEFMAEYGWYLVALFGGILIGLVYYMIRRPEDFFVIEDAQEDNTET